MWNKEKYDKYINELLLLQNQEYLDFTKKITMPQGEMIGIQIPKLREIAKKISKTNIDSFFSFYKGYYFEEKMIFGLVVGYSNDLSIYDKYLNIIAGELSDWSLCDCISSNLKLIGKNREHFYLRIVSFLKSDKEFIIRFGIVLLKIYYISDDYIDDILKLIVSIKSDYYYVNMAISWFLCECFIKYPLKTDKYISGKYLERFVLNKTISKISDSFRVSKEVKEELKKRKK